MILITCATGHIGNVLVRELLADGERVRVLVRSGKTPPALAGLDVEMVPGDILDTDSLERALGGFSLVYHLAARLSPLLVRTRKRNGSTWKGRAMSSQPSAGQGRPAWSMPVLFTR
jgi:uncharacterized protein YbjT (DUF2867 family)